MRTKKNPRSLFLVPVVAVMVAAGATTAIAVNGRPDKHHAATSSIPVPTGFSVAEGADWLPSTTAADWVTYADYVVAVTVFSERAGEVAKTSIERGEGVIPRSVGLKVDQTLWRSPQVDREPPTTLDWATYGWVFSNGNQDKATVLVGDGESRLEPGHKYIAAIAWQPRLCSEGDPDEQAGWRPLGGDAVLPFDAGKVGVGEVMGQSQTLDQAEQRVDREAPVPSMRDAVVGGDSSAVTNTLSKTSPQKREDFGREASSTCTN